MPGGPLATRRARRHRRRSALVLEHRVVLRIMRHEETTMRDLTIVAFRTVSAVSLLVIVSTLAGRTGSHVLASTAIEQAEGDAAPIYGVKLPAGYRDWTLISVARVGGPVNDMRAKLGNDVAISAFRQGKLPFPDGTIIARLAWNQATSEENN